MSATVWTELVSDIHATDCQVVVAVTGGGSKAISQLLEVPGGSQTLLEAVVPYSPEALQHWLSGTVDQACSEPTARAMAMAAWIRARQLAPESDSRRLIGLGATASLASDRPKRGGHRVHVAVHTASATSSFSLVLAKGARDRKKEEWLAAKLVLTVLGEASGADATAASKALLDQLHEEEPIERRRQEAEAGWTKLVLGKCASVAANATPKTVFPGAFHPFHEGHRRMAQFAAERLGEPVAYELSITNVDKPPLDFIELADRLADLRKLDEKSTVVLTAAPTFRQKAALFPGCTFIVGVDTIARIGDPRYYDGGEAGCATAIDEIAGCRCRFLVFGRELEGRFCVLSDVDLPDALRAICTEVPAADFRANISSTEIRAQD